MSVTFGLPNLVRIPSDPSFIHHNPWFLIQYLSPVCYSWFSAFVYIQSIRVVRKWGGGGGRGHTGGIKSFTDMSAELFWRVIYCDKPWPDDGSQSGSRSHRGLSSQCLHIIWEYDLATAIAIRPLIQPRTCEIGLSIFAAISWIKFACTTRASFPSITSTEIRNR